MVFYYLSRVVSSTGAFLYPTYASYKALSRRPASEKELERWLMYWSVMGAIVGTEYMAEWAISWIPFYWEVKTAFLLYLVLPQTQGSTVIYEAHLSPILRENEQVIDEYLTTFKVQFFEFIQEKARTLWQHAMAIVQGQPIASASAPQSGAPGQAGRPPTMNNPVGGTAQMAWNLWHAYGPSLMASGATILQSGAPTQGARGPSTSTASTSSYIPPSPSSQDQRTGPSFPVPQPATPSVIPLPPSTSYLPSESDSEQDASGKYEEIETDEGEGYTMRPDPPSRRGSWWGWGGKGDYEKVQKSE